MKIGCLTHLALIDWMEGHPDRAVDLADRALRRGENLDRFNEAIATAAMAEIRLLRREPAVARIHVERLAVLGEANDFPLYRMLAMLLGGWCLVEEGRLAEAVDLLESARVAKQQCQIEMLGTLHLVLQGRAATGHSVGTHLLEQALEEGERSGELLASAEAHREKGRRLAAVGRSDAAESCFARALDVAHGQGALVFELRAATDLAAEWAHKGQRARATELLSPIIASFNEGLDTPDLIEARSILSDLDRRCAAPGSERAVRRS
jgi:tetratricopeptide (TPR) repeat protein